jgi:hypothetical protein
LGRDGSARAAWAALTRSAKTGVVKSVQAVWFVRQPRAIPAARVCPPATVPLRGDCRRWASRRVSWPAAREQASGGSAERSLTRLLMTKISWAELTISRSLRALAIARRCVRSSRRRTIAIDGGQSRHAGRARDRSARNGIVPLRPSGRLLSRSGRRAARYCLGDTAGSGLMRAVARDRIRPNASGPRHLRFRRKRGPGRGVQYRCDTYAASPPGRRQLSPLRRPPSRSHGRIHKRRARCWQPACPAARTR